MKITAEWLAHHRTKRGGWNWHQMESIGISWPLTKGWLKNVIGKEISEDQAARFVKFGHIDTKEERKKLRHQLRKANQQKKQDWEKKQQIKKSVPVTVIRGEKVRTFQIQAPKPKKQSIDPNSDAFLLSYEWRRVRMEVLKRDGARCACCGATPQDGLRTHVDHIKPRRIYPQLALDLTNLQVLCEQCNHGKGNWDMTDWRERETELSEAERAHLREISRF